MWSKLLDHAKKSVTDSFKIASKRVMGIIADAAGDLIADKVARNSKLDSKNDRTLLMI